MQKREEAALKDTWDTNNLFSSLEDWQNELKKIESAITEGLQSITSKKGKLSNPLDLERLLNEYFSWSLKIELLYTYAHLKHDEDTANETFKTAFNQALACIYQFKTLTSFIEPEILHLSDEKIDELIKSEELKEFSWHLKKLKDQKKHVLPDEQEALLSLSGLALQTPSKAFGAFNNADLKYPPAIDSEGKEHELTHGSYQLHLKSPDRELRKSAFINMHQAYGNYENTVTELLSGKIQSHVFHMKARKFSSCLEAALFPHQISEKIYHNLIKSVNKGISALHDYVSLRKKCMGIDEIHAYDMYAPMSSEVDFNVSYEDACDTVVRSIEILGSEYQEKLRYGLLKERWVDIYENEGKRSGAYSGGCYSSYPYILLNFHGTFTDLMTLSHEAGHSMHSYYSNQKQPYQYASYPIFLAEIASTFHEELTYRQLLAETEDPAMKKYILCQKIDGMRATFFRQTMFAEFELMLHQMCESFTPLTPKDLNKKYKELNSRYFGNDFVVDEELGFEFLRIPHFYYNFYVYQYATGIAAAHLFAKKVMEEGQKDAYLTFISSGESKYPLEILKDAGINLEEENVFSNFINEFNETVNSLKSYVE